MIRDLRVKFKVLEVTIFQETQKSRIMMISWACIYAKIRHTALYFSWKWIIRQSSVFWAVKIEFSWFPSRAIPWTSCGRGITAPHHTSCIQHIISFQKKFIQSLKLSTLILKVDLFDFKNHLFNKSVITQLYLI